MNVTVSVKKLVIRIMVSAPLLHVQRAGKAEPVVQNAIREHLGRTVSRYVTVRATQLATMKMEHVQMGDVLQDGKGLTAIQNAMMEHLARTAKVNVTA